ncbi:Dolichyl-diphosphooligosaccharide--protein glycosyltransferase subunit stt3b, variant 2 [Cymbomonas tetramitiformis]|uniref:dolichyl-diphosphooligosaccharide--protein glycotransferase n=1 Tax=Cymbomonas tetramitiformis TaxID=36881 RepID=A0AAE0FYT6_9CHLO|nr:Dolichyl-diphosphooligosaccharide--protein glycosyltransferase subunit stt3b, variant 2 [Cymbomonas tetramitiformis]
MTGKSGVAISPLVLDSIGVKFSTKQLEILLRIAILSSTCLLAFSVRLFSVLRYESVIHEFDPYFNYRATLVLANKGYYEFWNWFDHESWYPLGRIVGGTVYPGLMWTAANLYWLLQLVTLTASLREVCVLTAPLFAALTAMLGYALGAEIRDRQTGLLAAALLAICPGYISRSVAGSFDNEGVAIFALLLTFYFFIKAVNSGSIAWSVAASLAYFYMASAWGGYVFVINLVPLYVVVMLLSGRFSERLYIAYSVFYIMGMLLAMQIRFIGFQHVQSGEHSMAMVTFALLQVYMLLAWIKARIADPAKFRLVMRLIVAAAGALGMAALGAAVLTGKISPWTGRFYALLDPTFAKEHIPIIASVSEHQPTTWSSFFFDLHMLMLLVPTGVHFCFKRLTDANVFLILYAMCSFYFAGVMVRLMLVTAPAMVLLSSIAISAMLTTYCQQLRAPAAPAAKLVKQSGGKSGGSAGNHLEGQREVAAGMTVGIFILLSFFVRHSTWVTAEAYSSPSIVLAAKQSDGSRMLFDDFREAYYWLRHNTPEDAKVMSWWDYGYQISVMANRTILVDNNTWNNTHIATVGRALCSSEEDAYYIMRGLDVDYVLVVFGGLTGFASDDINKFLWMVRIGAGVFPDIREADYLNQGEYRIDKEAPASFLNSLAYKLSFYRFGQIMTEHGKPTGFDRVRNVEIGNKDFELDYMEEAFTSANWIVRVYKVKDLDNRW